MNEQNDKTLVTWHEHSVERKRGCVVWFTGLSGSGKSTVANCVDQQLFERGASSFVLDGDNVRHGLNASQEKLSSAYGNDFAKRFGLGFGSEDRQENIRRIGAVSELFCQAGVIALTAFVSPYRRDRDMIREYFAAQASVNQQPATISKLEESRVITHDFVEVFVDTPIEICEQRDPKGLYKKARAGEIKGFTGIDDPYEAPENPELVLEAGNQPPEELAAQVVSFLEQVGKL